MSKLSFKKDLYTVIPIVISGFLCIGIAFLLWQKVNVAPEFIDTITEVTTVFISISGFLSAIIMVYLAASALGLRSNRINAIDQLSIITQKMHDFRSILEILYRSKMWLPGLQEYIDEEFEGLTFFEVKDFYKGHSKLAIEFLQERHNFEDTENLYLEVKSLLLTSPKQKRVPDQLNLPEVYDRAIVQKWLEHKCGSGLWYYFGYKYAIFKEALDLNAVYERHQEKIMALAHKIDNTYFEDSSFNENFISKLGEYVTKEVLPKLYQYQGSLTKTLPTLVRYLYFIFIILVLFGILIPLLSLLLTLPVWLLIISFSIVISIIFFIAISLYPFLANEAYRTEGRKR
jgi:hypothetical protein